MNRSAAPLKVRLVAAWQTFWFRDIPPHVYALLRVAFGIVGLVALYSLTPVSRYWPLGSMMPTPGGGLGIRAWIDALGMGTFAGWALFVALLAAFSSMVIGWQSRAAVFTAFLASVVLASWNPLPLSGAHHVLVMMLFCLSWADCGEAWSLDARLRQMAPSPAPIWPLRLVQIQLAVIYLNSGLSKLFSPVWRDGTAVHWALNLNVFHRFPGGIPAGFEWLGTLATYTTLFWEIGFAFMLLHRWTRRVAIAMGVGLHIGMGMMLELGTFSLVMLASYLAFLRPHVAAAVVPRMRLTPARSPRIDNTSHE